MTDTPKTRDKLPALDPTRPHWLTYRQTETQRIFHFFDSEAEARHWAAEEATRLETNVMVFGPQSAVFAPPPKQAQEVVLNFGAATRGSAVEDNVMPLGGSGKEIPSQVFDESEGCGE